jgi:hypothetical protein
MLRIRFFTVAAATLSLASIIGADGANAQNAATDQSTAPLSLMHLFSQPAAAAAPEPAAAPAPVQATTTRPRRVVSRRHRIASRKTAHGAQSAASSADPEQSNASADAWLTASAPAASTPAPAAAPDSAQRDAASPSALVIGGQTVQIAEANQVNEIDLAAASAPPEPSPNTQPVDADLPRSDRTDTISATDTQAAPTDAWQGSGSQVSQTAFVAPTPDGAAQIADGGTMVPPDSGAQDLSTQNSSAENSNVAASAALIAQVLAALGGALTAGILAWFLIGGAEPTRNYG